MIGAALVGLTRFLVGGRALWRGCEPAGEEQRIYFANHCSHLDTLLIWAALPPALRARTHPVAAADYWGGDGPKGWVARRVLRAVLVERSNNGGRKAATSALDPLREALRRGGSLILFPEGTRGAGRLPGAFKPGLYRLAREFPDAELIPVYLENPSRALPKGELIPVPIACSVHFGAPVRPAEGERAEAFLERARGAVAEMAVP